MPKPLNPNTYGYLWKFSINNHDWISHYCWLITSSEPAPEGSCVAFPECSHDLAKKVNAKSFRRPGQWTRTRIKYGSNMNIKLSQKRIRKGSGGFTHIVSALIPWAKPHEHYVSCAPAVAAQWSQVFLIVLIIKEQSLLDTTICFLAQRRSKDKVLQINTFVDNGQNWSWNVNKFFIFMTGNLFREPM